ncbi:MAG: pseudouridine synthase [Bacteroidota bacterium]
MFDKSQTILTSSIEIQTSKILPILFQDEHYVIINKPHNLLVHRTSISEEKEEFALQILRDQLGCWVSPSHRIDRKTSGILVFAKSKGADSAMGKLFHENQVKKAYLALVRGYLPDSGTCDRPLENEKGKMQEAITHFRCLQQVELEIEVSRYPTSRYSLTEIRPETGRMHQIRRHFAQMRHYLIGDKTHGECKQNKMFKERFGLNTMLLHASELSFVHPFTNQETYLKAEMSLEFKRVLGEIGMNY